MSQDERLLRAHDLAVSAFLAETIYNFGELVCRSADCEPRKTLIFAAFLPCDRGLALRELIHPILDSLDGTPHEWIKKLLFAFNEGNIGKFEAQSPLFGQEVRHYPLEAEGEI